MLRHFTLIFAVAFLLLIGGMAVLAPLLPLHDPVQMDVMSRLGKPSLTYLLGNDEYGRDIFSRIIYGAQASLAVSLSAAVLAAIGGVALGLLGGYFQGWIENITMRPLDVILSFPPMLLALLAVTLLGPGTGTLTVILAILFIPAYARVTYGEVLSVRNLEYVEAARALGHRSGRILLRTVLPNVAGPILVQFSLVVASCIVLESGLSFLGLGVVPPDSSWGLMIRGARPYMHMEPLGLLWPCLALVFTVFSINRLCDFLRDMFDPKASVAAFTLPGMLAGQRLSRTAHAMSRKAEPDSLLQIRDLTTEISTPRGPIRAIDGVTLQVRRGEAVALVGESGSGKSMTGLSVMKLLPRRIGRIASGEIWYSRGEGENARAIDLAPVPASHFRAYRGRDMGMVFQEPMACLNPVYTIGYQLVEAITVHNNVSKAKAEEMALAELKRVGIPDPERRLREYPHQLSGGMRQRVAIAIALCGQPNLLIADEPTTALDVTVQAQILELLEDIRRTSNIGLIFITHNLGVVAEIADRVVVMYCGQVVEEGSVEEIFYSPRHPYTRGLLASVPKPEDLNSGEKRLASIPGTVPSPLALPPGCRFAPRCSYSTEACSVAVPELEVVTESQAARCIRWKEI
ncbi:dipeptide/oligopeptide/nickel ABC transporter permease/ATP-binding protein [Telmatospirillum sp. J64-1]|uniref:dipeptide/oligopeptide/nickel ABC transporter permease/ATP-binding protein n=1 Tax=Telmatospirillum sp. J64-1 TaxID=2502183 RepID=UPI00115DE978|nr:dipeptide/oligopeptide/nickel ABC transporter permease/ATP-binding protein [Telmatospirillum sp. J64-1]